ncbi:MAG: hypothetical protein V1833_06670 [Elusimicrobiota bacterium]
MKRIRTVPILLNCFLLASLFCNENTLSKGVTDYNSGNYRAAIDCFTGVLSIDPKNKKAKKYLEKSANKLLEPERKAIEKERTYFMKEAFKALQEQQKENVKRKNEIKPFFSKAKRYYKKKWYLSATDKFSEILLKYPGHRSAKDYYEKIRINMTDTAKMEQTTNLEKLSYARGYISYYEQKLFDAVNEWEKTLQINPKRDELNEYIKNVKDYLKNTERLAIEKEIEERVKGLFAEGVSSFDKKSWVQCIKKMENVQNVCQTEPFPKSLDWYGKSQDYITKAIGELSKITVQRHITKPVFSALVEEQETDIAGAEKKYNEGLVLYAQGKLFDAVKKWEIAIRMNPCHEKAQHALEKSKKEMKLQKR